jgi:hypothetical protein
MLPSRDFTREEIDFDSTGRELRREKSRLDLDTKRPITPAEARERPEGSWLAPPLYRMREELPFYSLLKRKPTGGR